MARAGKPDLLPASSRAAAAACHLAAPGKDVRRERRPEPRTEIMPEINFTDRELDVMAVLWENGGATVAEVRERLSDELAYTTVLTVLRTLEEKGYVEHEPTEGRAYRYCPLVARKAAGASALKRVVGKLFAGRPELLLTELVSDRDLTEEDLDRMRRLLEERLEEER
jgi:BlaI family penicillinase repressor